MQAKVNRRNLIIVSWFAILVLGVSSVVAYFFAKADWHGQVTAFDWQREQDVERYMIVGGTCWHRGCEPQRAYNVHHRSEIHHWNRVKTGESCTSDSKGWWSCTPTYTSYPVFETKVYYDVNDWRIGRLVKAMGDTNRMSDLYWPTLNLNDCGVVELGIGGDDPGLNCERPGGQREWYFVHLQPDSADVLPNRCAIEFARWTDTPIGREVSGSYWLYQKFIDCAVLEW